MKMIFKLSGWSGDSDLVGKVIGFALLTLLQASAIAGNQLELTSPVAGGVYERDLLVITWSAPEITGNVKIEFSDDGEYFSTLTEVSASKGELICRLITYNDYDGIYSFYTADGSALLDGRNTFGYTGNTNLIRISGLGGSDSDGYPSRQEAEIGPFSIKYPTTFLEAVGKQDKRIGDSFALKATTSAPAPFLISEYSVDNGSTWKFGTYYVRTNTILKMRSYQEENEAEFQLIDVEADTDSRASFPPDFSDLPLGKPVLFRLKAGLLGDPSNSVSLMISTDKSKPVERTIRGRVGRRVKKALRSIDGTPKRSRRLPKGLRFRSAIQSILGRPRRAVRTTVVFTDSRGFQTVVRFRIQSRNSPSR